MKRRSAEKILELGTADASLLLEIISSAEWTAKIELHCTESAADSFDESLVAAAEKTNTEFELIKHVGSEIEVNDAIMELAASLPFDAIFISNSSSKEALLTSFMVANESLKSGGLLSLSAHLVTNASMSDAISTFRDMFGDMYVEPSDYLFVKI